MSLRERQEGYEIQCDSVIIRKLPVIIRAELRNFKRLTRELEKPHSSELLEVMANTMMYAITEIQDAVFGYYNNNEITFVLRNDLATNGNGEPWNQNNIQKICSTVSSLLTIGFYRYKDICCDDIPLVGDAIFRSKVFALPYLGEVVNHLIWRQQLGIRHALQEAASFELSEKFDKKTANKILYNKTDDEKLELLLHHCGIDFYDYYDTAFYYGVAAYKAPTILQTKDGEIDKRKWILNYDVSDFIDEKDFVLNILINGHDVFRASELTKIKS